VVRETNDEAARFVAALVRPGQKEASGRVGYGVRYRTAPGEFQYVTAGRRAAGEPGAWVRLKRTGDMVSAWCSADGARWQMLSEVKLPLPETVVLGVMATGGDGKPVRLRGLSNLREQEWIYPSQKDCLTCHNANAHFVLGVNTRQLNGDCTYPQGVQENQLKVWSRLGLFNKTLTDEEIARLPKLVAMSDHSASLEDRVRSYLDANCGHCHRPNGVRGFFDARWETSLAEQKIIDGEVYSDFGRKGARVLKPHNDELSLLYERMKSCDASFRMPPLGRCVRDGEATEAVREWVSSVPLTKEQKRPMLRLKRLAINWSVSVFLALLLGWGLRLPRYQSILLSLPLARFLPLLVGLGVPTYAAVRGMQYMAAGQDGLVQILGACGAAVVSLVIFGRPAPRPRPTILVVPTTASQATRTRRRAA
jgi:hypothetical protein